MAFACISGGKECTGCMRCQEDEKTYKCPICGHEIGGGDDLFISKDGDVIGCDECVRRKEAWEVLGGDDE